MLEHVGEAINKCLENDEQLRKNKIIAKHKTSIKRIQYDHNKGFLNDEMAYDLTTKELKKYKEKKENIKSQYFYLQEENCRIDLINKYIDKIVINWEREKIKIVLKSI
ncbi:MAG: hypothetical protein WBO70_02790 [Erysipelotrichaceae bacterium]